MYRREKKQGDEEEQSKKKVREREQQREVDTLWIKRLRKEQKGEWGAVGATRRQHYCCIIIKVLPALKSNARDPCGSKLLNTVTANRGA